jgi:hypothetical protein
MRGRMGGMVCEHLKTLDDALTAAGVAVVYRDQQPWSRNCRNWTRYAVSFDMTAVREQFGFSDCVVDWEIDDHWQGTERGFVCQEHNDAIIGDFYPPRERGKPRWYKTWAIPIIGCVLSVLAVVFAVAMAAARK